MKKQILLYNIKDKKRAMDIRRVLMPLKIRIKTISPDEFAHPIGYLLGLSGYEASDAPAQDYFFEDEMMIMADLPVMTLISSFADSINAESKGFP